MINKTPLFPMEKSINPSEINRNLINIKIDILTKHKNKHTSLHGVKLSKKVKTKKSNNLNMSILPSNNHNLHRKQRSKPRNIINKILSKLSKEEQKIIINIMDYDNLTNIKNRNCFNREVKEEVKKAIKYNYSISFILADIDNFKQVNDTKGHKAGDKLLKTVSKHIRANIRKGIDLLYRYGGEEFIIILPNTNLKKAYQISERVRKAVKNKTKKSISLGISIYNKTKSLNLSILETDKALYKSKENGKNQTIIYKNEVKNLKNLLEINKDKEVY